MGYIGAIISAVGAGIKLIGSATSSPNYPSMPKLYKLPVQKAKQHLEDYEQKRMDASIEAWKTRFPDLYKGGQFMVDDIQKQQQGKLGGNIAADMKASGLGPVREGDQYALSRDIGLNPLTLSQRTSQAVTRQIAQNPEWTNTITGGTLATMLANNYQNATAYGMMTNANNTARYVAGKQAGMYNTQALLGGITGAARVGSSIYNRFNPLSPEGQGAYVPPAATNAPTTGSTYSSPAYGGYPQAPMGPVSPTGPWSGGYQFGSFYDQGNTQEPPAAYGPYANQYSYGVSPYMTTGMQYTYGNEPSYLTGY